ncbi:hypothetical protein IPG36_05765 [bacterium]|nr:MAG: hypothetical protein IPG36_05765 [bacterium]
MRLREIMLSSKNLLKPADGEVVVDATKDMVLGNYYLTFLKFDEKKAYKVVSSSNEAILAYETGAIKLQTLIKVPIEGNLIETTVGRILFNEILPADFGFRNETMTKKYSSVSWAKSLSATVVTRLPRSLTSSKTSDSSIQPLLVYQSHSTTTSFPRTKLASLATAKSKLLPSPASTSKVSLPKTSATNALSTPGRKPTTPS